MQCSMYAEVYDDFANKICCVHSIKVHVLECLRVGLTYGSRLQSVYSCVDCGVQCTKLMRPRLPDAANTVLPDFVCVEYNEESETTIAYK